MFRLMGHIEEINMKQLDMVCWILIFESQKPHHFRVLRVFLDRGKKPPKEGKNALVVLSVFTHIIVLSVFTHYCPKCVHTHHYPKCVHTSLS